MSLSARLYFFI